MKNKKAKRDGRQTKKNEGRLTEELLRIQLANQKAKTKLLKKQQLQQKKGDERGWLRAALVELLVLPTWSVAKGFLRLLIFLVVFRLLFQVVVSNWMPHTEEQAKLVYKEHRLAVSTLCENSKGFDLGVCGTLKHVLDGWAFNDSKGMCPINGNADAKNSQVTITSSTRIQTASTITTPSPLSQTQLYEWIQLTARRIHDTRKELLPQANEFEKNKYEIFESFEVEAFSVHDLNIPDDKLEDYLALLKGNNPSSEIQKLTAAGVRFTGAKNVYAMYYGFKGELTGEKELGQLFYYRDSDDKHNFFFAAARIHFKIKEQKETLFKRIYNNILPANSNPNGDPEGDSNNSNAKLSTMNGMDAFLRLNFYNQFQSAGYLSDTVLSPAQ